MQSIEKTSKQQTNYGVEVFPKNMLFFHTLQKSMLYNPLVLPKMIILK
jgi:hypothetical protein